MARGLPSALWAGRELVDRLARQSPARLAIGTFAGVVGIVTMLLSMPWATASGHRAPLVDALFTATSAPARAMRPRRTAGASPRSPRRTLNISSRR